jgi:hypothetical protein
MDPLDPIHFYFQELFAHSATIEHSAKSPLATQGVFDYIDAVPPASPLPWPDRPSRGGRSMGDQVAGGCYCDRVERDLLPSLRLKGIPAVP